MTVDTEATIQEVRTGLETFRDPFFEIGEWRGENLDRGLAALDLLASTLRGHRICEQNADAEIAQLTARLAERDEVLRKLADTEHTWDGRDCNEVHDIARRALGE